MKPDPTSKVETKTHRWPPSRGPGSGKAAWVAEAIALQQANEGLSSVIAEQADLIRDLKAEIALLRDQIAGRRPRGGREAVDQAKVDGIERAVEAGLTTRAIGRQFGVSAMTVSRVKRRMLARRAVQA